MTPGLRQIATLLALLLPFSAAALPLDRVYELDWMRSRLRVCEQLEIGCQRSAVGRVRLSLDVEAATLEILRFGLGPLPHEAIPDLMTLILWSGIHSGNVIASAADSSQALFYARSGDIEATILAELSADVVHFTGGDSRGYTYDFWGAALPEPGAELLLASLLAIGAVRAMRWSWRTT